MHPDRDAAAVVGDLNTTVFQNPDDDLVGEAYHRLVHRVVDDFPDQVVQTALSGGPDVHARAFADGFEAFENFDRLCAVCLRGILFWAATMRMLSLGYATPTGGSPVRAKCCR